MRISSLRAAVLTLAFPCALGAAGCVSEASQSYIPYELQGLAKRPLGPAEHDILKAKSFVLSTVEPLSYHEGYAALYKAHEPVYFTADAILHALHASFDTILADVETEVLARELGKLLDALRAGLTRNVMAEAHVRRDLDVYLTVARSLLTGAAAAPVAGGDASIVNAIFKAATDAAGPTEVALFGGTQLRDLSMMKPRGHYTRSEQLTRYFRAMMWLGTVDFRLAEKEGGKWQVGRDAVSAAALVSEISTPEVVAAWQKIDKASQVFVGPADSMSLPGLSRSLKTLDFPATPLASRSDDDLVRALAPEASQKILGSMTHAQEHPLAFLLLGQRFVFDSLVFSETTYARLPAHRMMPSPLDMAAAVLKNPLAETLLAPELDRYGYRDALHAVAHEGEVAGSSLWEGSVYHGWLRALSRLSPDPVRDKPLPPVFRSEAWQRRMLSTQLASWAELRHDTILYAKQSYTTMAGCDYPDGYVDPYPEFFSEVGHLATLSAGLVNDLDFGEKKHLQSRILKYFEHLGGVVQRLGKMASLERQNAPLGPDDVDYLKEAVALHAENHVCTTVTVPVGWHAQLYFDRDDILKREPIVADVHTQPTDEEGAMVGHVLHVGTGHPRQITIVIETDTGSRTYRGMVGSYHEVITDNFQRMNDEEWRKRLAEKPPEDPPWLAGLVATSAVPKR